MLITNKIETIDLEGLGKLPMLAVLDLRNNNIGHVPPELGLLTQLRSGLEAYQKFSFSNHTISK